jgi:hypothetical protein
MMSLHFSLFNWAKRLMPFAFPSLKVIVLGLACLQPHLAAPVIAQTKAIDSEYYSNQLPKAPDPAVLGAFGNTPVNLYRGLPEVSIALMTLKDREATLPVTLQYDASGIKVDDLSGPVGIKWNLNAGGFVARNVNGLPDEDYNQGYFKHAGPSSYFQSGDPASWASLCERNVRDTAPDDFVVSINGRTIRFVFDKNLTAVTIPRQNVLINFFTEKQTKIVTAERITGFEVTLEDGARYTFGTKPEAIVRRKVETLIVYSSFFEKVLGNCQKSVLPTDHPATSYDCFNTLSLTYNPAVSLELQSKTYNARWNLVSIAYPSGEKIEFKYEEIGDIRYNTRPSILRILPAYTYVPKFVYRKKYCPGTVVFGACVGGFAETIYNYYNHPAILKFGNTDPGTFATPRADPPIFNLVEFPANGGGMNTYYTLVTESNQKLNEITTTSGNRISLKSSASDEVPGATKYDVISLYNMDGDLVKAIRLNYLLVNSIVNKDHFWFAEALLMREFKELHVSRSEYYANDIYNYRDADIPNGNLRAYVFEGLKEHNYRRLFLRSVEDVTNPHVKISMFDFEYDRVDKLRRRTSPYQDQYGFPVTWKGFNKWEFKSGKSAVISAGGKSDSTDTRIGLLRQIMYPTNGTSRFIYKKMGPEHKLVRIDDVDEEGIVKHSREFEYDLIVPRSAVVQSYQEYNISGTTDWMKYSISTSTPQNDWSPSQGVISVSRKTIVYEGSKTDNNGFSVYEFSHGGHHDVAALIHSSPSESNLDGSPLRNIFPFPKNHEKDHLRGLLLSHSIFKKGSSLQALSGLVRTIRYEYDFNPYNYKCPLVLGFKGGSFIWTSKPKTTFLYGHGEERKPRYRYSWYPITGDWIVLKRRSETVVDEDDSASKRTTIEEYVYDLNSLQLTQTSAYVEAMPEERVITRTKYATHQDYQFTRPCDDEYASCVNYCKSTDGFSDCREQCRTAYNACANDRGAAEVAAIHILKSNHQILVPIEIQEWNELGPKRYLREAKLYKYGQVGSIKGPKVMEVWHTAQALSPAEYSEAKVANTGRLTHDPRMRKVHVYDEYDRVHGALLRQTLLDGKVQRFGWTKNGSVLLSSTLNPGAEEHHTSNISKPLIGIVESTDANGLSTRYRFDRNNRLTHILDYVNDILKRFRYHYSRDVENEKLSASFTVTGARTVGSTIIFRASTEVRDYGNITFTWDAPGAFKKITETGVMSHAFDTPGTYLVILTKRHPEYGSASDAMTIKITDPLSVDVCIDGPRVIDVTRQAGPIASGDCTSSSSTPTKTMLKANVRGGCPPYTFKWEMQSSNRWVGLPAVTALSQAPSGFTKQIPGTYPFRCTVTDNCGNIIESPVYDLEVI